MSIIFGQLTSFSILEGRWDRMIHEHNSFALTRNSPNFLHITDKTFIRRVDLLFRCVCLNLSSQHIYISFQLVSSDIWTRKDDEYLSISATICLVHLFCVRVRGCLSDLLVSIEREQVFKGLPKRPKSSISWGARTWVACRLLPPMP